MTVEHGGEYGKKTARRGVLFVRYFCLTLPSSKRGINGHPYRYRQGPGDPAQGPPAASWNSAWRKSCGGEAAWRPDRGESPATYRQDFRCLRISEKRRRPYFVN